MYYLVYNFLISLVLTAAILLLPLWLAIRPRFRPGLAERFGWYANEKVTEFVGARPLWIHAASVGEVFAASRLLAALRAELPGQKIVVSTFTDTGNEIARRTACADAVIFLPLDHPLILRRTFARLDPAALILVETELWPNLLREAYRRGIPAIWLSGRISERSLKRYFVFRGFFQRVLRCFVVLGMQSEDDAHRAKQLGAEAFRVKVAGNLKRAGRISAGGYEAQSQSGEGARKPAKRHLLVVGSSHQGEEETLLRVFLSLRKQFTGIQLALAPRHPERFGAVEKLLQSKKISFEKKSRIDGRMSFEQDVMLIDTLGDLGKFYARADIAFVGGSLVDVGGHNLLEPAIFKKPVLFGPFVENVRTVAEEMKQNGGGIEVRDSGELECAIAVLLGNPEKRRNAGEKAFEVAVRDGAVVERSLALLRSYVDFSAGSDARTGTKEDHGSHGRV